MYFSISFKEMIRIDLFNTENVKFMASLFFPFMYSTLLFKFAYCH